MSEKPIKNLEKLGKMEEYQEFLKYKREKEKRLQEEFLIWKLDKTKFLPEIKIRTSWNKNLPSNLQPGWQGGKSFEPYGIEFNEKLKEQIRKKDNFRCQECFREQKELFMKNRTGKIVPYRLSVHHIDYDKNNNHPDNLISLCRSCHQQTNFGRQDWISYFNGRK